MAYTQTLLYIFRQHTLQPLCSYEKSYARYCKMTHTAIFFQTRKLSEPSIFKHYLHNFTIINGYMAVDGQLSLRMNYQNQPPHIVSLFDRLTVLYGGYLSILRYSGSIGSAGLNINFETKLHHKKTNQNKPPHIISSLIV